MLPKGKSVIDVFGDFLKYLANCARSYIIETHPNGNSLWASVEDQIEVVLSHPNGWEGLLSLVRSCKRDKSCKRPFRASLAHLLLPVK